MRFAHAGRSEQQHVVGIGDEAAGGQFAHHLRLDRGLKLEVEALQALVERKARHGRLHRRVALLLGRQLAAEQLLQQVAVGQLFLARILQQQGQLLAVRTSLSCCICSWIARLAHRRSRLHLLEHRLVAVQRADLDSPDLPR